MCAGNTDTTEEPDIQCPSPSVIVPTREGRTTEICCQTSGKCFGNTNSNEDFDCSAERMNNKVNLDESLISCTGECTKEICCDNIIGKCIGNTDVENEPDITCEEPSTLISDANNINGRDSDTCCNVTGRCSGNTGGIGDVVCDSTKGETILLDSNGNPIIKDLSGGKSEHEACCHRTGYCQNNTDSNEDFTDSKCRQGLSLPSDLIVVVKNVPRCSDPEILTESECISPNEWIVPQQGTCSDESILVESECTGDDVVWTPYDLTTPSGKGWDESYSSDELLGKKQSYCCNYLSYTGTASPSSSSTLEPPTFTCSNFEGQLNEVCTQANNLIYDSTINGEIECATNPCTVAECCTEPFTNIEGFNNIEKYIGYSMLIEGQTNNTEEITLEPIEIDEEANCNNIKEETLETLGIEEEQLIFTCSLDDIGFNITTTVIPKEGEELSDDLINKVKSGFKLPSYKQIIQDFKEEEEETFTWRIIPIILFMIILTAAIVYFATK